MTTMTTKPGLIEPVYGVHRVHIRHLRYNACRGAVRAPVRAVPEKLNPGVDFRVEERFEVEREKRGKRDPSAVSNILSFFGGRSHGAGAAAAGAAREAAGAAFRSDVTRGAAKSPPALFRVLVVLIRLLPYAFRSRIGAYRFLDRRAKKRADLKKKNALVSRHRLEYVVGISHSTFDPPPTNSPTHSPTHSPTVPLLARVLT